MRSSGDEEADTEISQYLIDMESAALKRVIKLKPNETAMFHNVLSQELCMEGTVRASKIGSGWSLV